MMIDVKIPRTLFHVLLGKENDHYCLLTNDLMALFLLLLLSLLTRYVVQCNTNSLGVESRHREPPRGRYLSSGSLKSEIHSQ